MQKCIKCSNEKEIVHFDVKQNGERYKTCNECREKENNKRTKVNCTNEETKKRENRPSISFQTKQEILKEQNYCCRGPNKNDNNEYECDMNINGKKFCGILQEMITFNNRKYLIIGIGIKVIPLIKGTI